MGANLLRTSKISLSPIDLDHSENWKSLRKMYIQRTLVTAGNPKAIIFFTAIFPQFVDPNTFNIFTKPR
ncbi:MAG: hypothetical protein GY792_01415 [Gammaproteobacteria bacterium]|nr:hypothetical protein [Gammaproteobacteria bacterium]